MAERCPTGRRTVHAAPAPHTMQSANLRLTAVERAHPFSKAHCRLPRRRPKTRLLYRASPPAWLVLLFPPKQKRLLRGQSQSRAAGVCLLLSASAAAHEDGNRLSARREKSILAHPVYRKKPPPESGRFRAITAPKILEGQRQGTFAKQNTPLWQI